MVRPILFTGYNLHGLRLVGSLIQQGAFYYIQNKQGGNDRVIENTIGQYTGKEDSKGKSIFETDRILRTISGNYYTVVFNDCEFALKREIDGQLYALNSFESEDLLVENI